MITLNINRPLHIKVPRVFRYMHEEYIDKFFTDGLLRIGSFQRFRNYPDEIRGDKQEGSGSIIGTGEQSNFQFILMTNVGENGYLLSASLEESTEIETAFGVDSYL